VALRRSELVALDVEHLEFDARGLTVLISKSKTDQERAGARVAVPYARAGSHLCALRALLAWLDTAGIRRGPCSGRCDAATRSPTGGSQTSPLR
jgi:integrase